VVYSGDIAGVGVAHDIKPTLIFPDDDNKLSDQPETPSKSHYGILKIYLAILWNFIIVTD